MCIGARQQVVDPPRGSIGNEPEPFAHRNVGPRQPVKGEGGEGKCVAPTADLPVDRISLDRKSGFAKQANRSRHMER